MARLRNKDIDDELDDEKLRQRLDALNTNAAMPRDEVGEKRSNMFAIIFVAVTSAMVFYVLGRTGLCLLPPPLNLCELSAMVDEFITGVLGF
jgi:hypothetical protein